MSASAPGHGLAWLADMYVSLGSSIIFWCLSHLCIQKRMLLLCRYGFIVMDGNGSLFGTLSGNTREVLHKFTVELPKKHGRGGQSALRFARLRLEKRHNYVRKVGDMLAM